MRDMAATTAALLRQGRGLDRLSRGLTLIGALVVFFSPLSWPGAALVLAGAVQSWFAFRVGFDAALFAALGRGGQSLDGMDAALVALGLLPEAKIGRDLALRAAGARRLLMWQAIALLAQMAICLIAAVLAVPWSAMPG